MDRETTESIYWTKCLRQLINFACILITDNIFVKICTDFWFTTRFMENGNELLTRLYEKRLNVMS